MKGGAGAIARFGILTALALLLGYIEQMIPIAPGLPGVKIGLSNIVLLYAIYLIGPKSAWILMLSKVLLSGLLFAGPTAAIYSLAGGICSLTGMTLFMRIRGVGVVGVSIVGAVLHNAGQLVVAMLALRSTGLLAYAPVLLASGLAAGVLTGLIAHFSLPGIRIVHNKALPQPAREPGKKGAKAAEHAPEEKE